MHQYWASIIKEEDGKGTGIKYVVAKAKTKKQHDTNGGVQSSYCMMSTCTVPIQSANTSLQSLDRHMHVLTVGAVSSPHYQNGTLHWYHFTSYEFTWLAKSTLEKQVSSH